MFLLRSGQGLKLSGVGCAAQCFQELPYLFVGIDRMSMMNVYVDKVFLLVFGQGEIDELQKVGEWHPFEDCACATERSISFACVFQPAAPRVVFDIFYDESLGGILVDVAQEGDEIVPVVDGLALEAFLKEVPDAPVSVVIIVDVRRCDAFHRLADGLADLLHEEVDMVAHEAVGIETAVWLCLACCRINFGDSLCSQNIKESPIVVFILEYLLFVDSSQNGVVDVGRCLYSSFTWHNA